MGAPLLLAAGDIKKADAVVELGAAKTYYGEVYELFGHLMNFYSGKGSNRLFSAYPPS